MTKVKGKIAKRTFARLGLVLQGVIYGLYIADWSHQDIADEVTKSDGTHPSKGAVGNVIRAMEAGQTYGDMSITGTCH